MTNSINTIPAWLLAKRASVAPVATSDNVHTVPMPAPIPVTGMRARKVCPILDATESDDHDYSPTNCGDTYTDEYDSSDMSFCVEA